MCSESALAFLVFLSPLDRFFTLSEFSVAKVIYCKQHKGLGFLIPWAQSCPQCTGTGFSAEPVSREKCHFIHSVWSPGCQALTHTLLSKEDDVLQMWR